MFLLVEVGRLPTPRLDIALSRWRLLRRLMLVHINLRESALTIIVAVDVGAGGLPLDWLLLPDTLLHRCQVLPHVNLIGCV